MRLESTEANRPNIKDLTLDRPQPSFRRRNLGIPFDPLEMVDPLLWSFIGDHVTGSESYSVGVALFMKLTNPNSYYERYGGRPSIFDTVLRKKDDIIDSFEERKKNIADFEIEDIGYMGALEYASTAVQLFPDLRDKFQTDTENLLTLEKLHERSMKDISEEPFISECAAGKIVFPSEDIVGFNWFESTKARAFDLTLQKDWESVLSLGASLRILDSNSRIKLDDYDWVEINAYLNVLLSGAHIDSFSRDGLNAQIIEARDVLVTDDGMKIDLGERRAPSLEFKYGIPAQRRF